MEKVKGGQGCLSCFGCVMYMFLFFFGRFLVSCVDGWLWICLSSSDWAAWAMLTFVKGCFLAFFIQGREVQVDRKLLDVLGKFLSYHGSIQQ